MEIIKFTDKKFELDVTVSPENDTVWLSQDEIAKLFNKDVKTISSHIIRIYKDKELEERSTFSFFEKVQNESGRLIKRKIKYYNLDLIISVGYRVNSKRGIMFRKWASNILKQFLINGYAIDNKRIEIIDSNYKNLVYDVSQLKIENKGIKLQIDKLNHNAITCVDNKLFLDGQVFDALSYVNKIIKCAKNEIILIDPYVSIETLDYFVDAKCKISIFSSNKSRLTNINVDKYNEQYHNLKYSIVNNIHDRFLIVDNKDLYSLGTSLNFAGKKLFIITKINNKAIMETILKEISYEK